MSIVTIAHFDTNPYPDPLRGYHFYNHKHRIKHEQIVCIFGGFGVELQIRTLVRKR